MLSAKQTSKGHRLVCLRNPWGEFEWKGDWSDNSSLWTDDIVKEVGATFNDKDGLFWMSYQDFREHFSKVNICHVHSKSGTAWKDFRIKGRFQYSGSDVSFPFISMTVEDATEAWVSIHQDDERILHGQPYVDLGFVVLRKEKDGSLAFVDACGGGWSREAQLNIPTLAPGSYMIVPFTSGHRREAKESRSLSKMFEAEECFTTGFRQIISEIFRRYDEDMSGFLAFREFSELYQKAFNKDLSEDGFAALLQEYDSTDTGITRDGFRDFLAQLKEDQVLKVIRNLGYNEKFHLVDERRFIVSVHAETAACTLKRTPYDSALHEDALTKWVSATGVPTEYDNGNLIVYQLSRGTAGTTLAVKSNYAENCQVTVDCNKSDNVGTTSDSLAVEKTIPAGTLAVFHHLFPLDASSTWRWAYRLNIVR
ncbi:hypothetical protein PTSG_00064 [Salpingoeca rosetta]|uniref:Calpain catalytic domain-containing protein n=1 Tax=Salpingoeca rosetta (strain ATCC 50818 / BSB-021) TaxID=946362 RepID=F2TVF2_SALR5|nr:uncharacterized protein PTSG_00064 [Salpingoeca rosetta]EGD72048.1 hypothetical protein PTSG_00064 [Salpingoeca rosetta]|eukprot:XP_004998620.1 hypothetical protein PTSG_00064 [Salpingoeca rosetta]